MSEHDDHDESKGGLHKDNPEPEDTTDKGLGGETGGDRGPNDPGSRVTDSMPESRGEVRYPDTENPDDAREDAVPVEGGVDTDPDRVRDASTGSD